MTSLGHYYFFEEKTIKSKKGNSPRACIVPAGMVCGFSAINLAIVNCTTTEGVLRDLSTIKARGCFVSTTADSVVNKVECL